MSQDEANEKAFKEKEQKETTERLKKITEHIQAAFTLYKTDKLGIRSFLDLTIASIEPGIGLEKMHEIYDDKVIEIECYLEAYNDKTTGI